MFKNYGWKLVVSVSPARPLYLVGYLHQTQIALVKFLLGLVCFSNDFWFYPLCRLACAFIKLFINKQIEVKDQSQRWEFRCPCLYSFIILPPILLKSPWVLKKVGLVMGECIVMCCRYLRYPTTWSHTFTAPPIFANFTLRVMGRLHVLSQIKIIPTHSAVVINPLFIPVQVLIMAVHWVVALCLHKLDQDSVIYVGLGNLEAFKAVNSVVESPILTLKRGFWLLCLQSLRVRFRVDRGLSGNILYPGLKLHFCQSIPPSIFSPSFFLLTAQPTVPM